MAHASLRGLALAQAEASQASTLTQSPHPKPPPKALTLTLKVLDSEDAVRTLVAMLHAQAPGVAAGAATALAELMAPQNGEIH